MCCCGGGQRQGRVLSDYREVPQGQGRGSTTDQTERREGNRRPECEIGKMKLSRRTKGITEWRAFRCVPYPRRTVRRAATPAAPSRAARVSCWRKPVSTCTPDSRTRCAEPARSGLDQLRPSTALGEGPLFALADLNCRIRTRPLCAIGGFMRCCKQRQPLLQVIANLRQKSGWAVRFGRKVIPASRYDLLFVLTRAGSRPRSDHFVLEKSLSSTHHSVSANLPSVSIFTLISCWSAQ